MNEIEKIIESFGCKLYDTEIEKIQKDTIYRVLVYKQGGVSLDELTQISRALSPLLDVKPPMSCAYTLEVSSPGLERKLKKLDHYLSSIGETIKINVDGKNIKGVLLKADAQSITLKSKHGEETHGLDKIATAKTMFEWKSDKNADS